jgi:hypothetical protein
MPIFTFNIYSNKVFERALLKQKNLSLDIVTLVWVILLFTLGLNKLYKYIIMANQTAIAIGGKG